MDGERRLPDRWLEQNGPDPSGVEGTFRGHPITDYDRESLLAIVRFLGRQQRTDREEHMRQLKFLGELKRV
jgi:hypothetical protein